MKRLVFYFFQGCLVLFPLVATVAIIGYSVIALDAMLGVPFPGLGLLVVVGMTLLVGFLVSNVVGRTLFRFTDAVFRRLPLVKLLYGSLRDLVGAFVGDHKRFDQPVAVNLDALGKVKIFGFVTREDLTALGQPGHVAVYLPQSYNFAGNLLAVNRDSIEPLDLKAADLMAFVVSGGVSGMGPS